MHGRPWPAWPPLCAGFAHAAFSLAHESHVHNANIDPSQVPSGALVTFIQKGMQYMELEANVEVQGIVWKGRV